MKHLKAGVVLLAYGRTDDFGILWGIGMGCCWEGSLVFGRCGGWLENFRNFGGCMGM